MVTGSPVLRAVWIAALVWLAPAASWAEPVTVTDVERRTVTLEAPPERILLGEGHVLPTMALIHPDPAPLIVAWQGDLRLYNTLIYESFLEGTPSLADVPVLGKANPDTFSVESALASRPDVAIFSGSYGPGPDTTSVVQRFEDAGIPIVYLDFWVDPLNNTVPSMRALGQLLGREEQAEAFIDFYEGRLNLIRERLEEVDARPEVFLQAHTGAWDCCWVPGATNFSDFIELAGGRSIGSEDFPGRPWGQLTLERVLTENPPIMIATGGTYLRGMGGTVLGPEVDDAEARSTFEAAIATPGIAQLEAVSSGRVYGMWHLFQNMPLNFLAVEAFAKWIHPELFADIDPAATLEDVNERFLSVPLEGTFFLDPAQEEQRP